MKAYIRASRNYYTRSRPAHPAHPPSAFTLLELLVVVRIIAILVTLGAAAVRGAWQRARAMDCQANLRQIGMATGAHEAAHGVFPFGVDPDVSPHARRFSIHSQLLAYLVQDELYHQINFLRIAGRRSTLDAPEPPNRATSVPGFFRETENPTPEKRNRRRGRRKIRPPCDCTSRADATY